MEGRASLKPREKREIVKLSDTVKAILDSLKNTAVDYVCRNDVNRELCERILRRRLSYNVIIEALSNVVQDDELLRLMFVRRALEFALGEGALILMWKETIDEKINEVMKTKRGEKEDTARSIDCTRNREACRQLVEQSINELRKSLGLGE
jgi:hypothetical protein